MTQRQLPRRVRMWQRIAAYAQAKLRDAWMDYRKHDRACPHCGRWGAETGGWATLKASDHPMCDWLQCGGCGQWSLWWDEMAPYPVDPATLTPLLDFETLRAVRLRNPPPPGPT